MYQGKAKRVHVDSTTNINPLHGRAYMYIHLEGCQLELIRGSGNHLD